MKKTKRYLVVHGPQKEPEVWIQHADYSVRVTTLHPVDIEGSKVPIIDMRSDVVDIDDRGFIAG